MRNRVYAVAVVSVLFVGWAFYCYPPRDSATIASWVQAIGSLVAIGLAIWLSELQAKRTENMQTLLRAERYGELYGPAIAIAEATITRLNEAYWQAIDDRKNSVFGVKDAFYKGRLGLQEAFAGIPVHQMPTVPSAASLLHIRELFIQADEVMERIGFKFDHLQTLTESDTLEFRDHVNLWQGELDALRADLVKSTAPPKD